MRKLFEFNGVTAQDERRFSEKVLQEAYQSGVIETSHLRFCVPAKKGNKKLNFSQWLTAYGLSIQ